MNVLEASYSSLEDKRRDLVFCNRMIGNITSLAHLKFHLAHFQIISLLSHAHFNKKDLSKKLLLLNLLKWPSLAGKKTPNHSNQHKNPYTMSPYPEF